MAMNNKGLKCKSGQNNDENVVEYDPARKEQITTNEEYLSSLGLGNKYVVIPCTFTLLCIFHESCL